VSNFIFPPELKSSLSSPSEKASQFALMYGMEVRVSTSLTIRVQFSRSPSRARRRATRGYPQHFVDRPDPKVYQLGRTLVMHPAIFDQLKQELARRADDLERRALLAPKTPTPTLATTGRAGNFDADRVKYVMDMWRHFLPQTTPRPKDLWS